MFGRVSIAGNLSRQRHTRRGIAALPIRPMLTENARGNVFTLDREQFQAHRAVNNGQDGITAVLSVESGLTEHPFQLRISLCLGNFVGGHGVTFRANRKYLGDKTNSYNLPYLLLKQKPPAETGGGRRHTGRNIMPTKNDFNIKQGDKTLGVIDGDVLRIIKTSGDHFVRKYKGYGISPSTLDKAEANNCHLLEFTTPKNKTYLFPIEDFRRAAIPDDLGFGRQLFMAERWMNWYSEKYAEICTPSPRQLSMELFSHAK